MAAVSWHPDDQTGVRAKTSLANIQVFYKFDGKASHASAKPHLGRSALDAVELIRDGALLEEAKAEFRRRIGPNGYQCPIPESIRPRAMCSFLK